MQAKALLLPVLLFVLSAAAPAECAVQSSQYGGKDVVTGYTKGVIEIGLTYSGDRIHFFGTLGESGADAVVVKLTSPAEKVKLNVAGRVGPLWMNVKQYEVDNVPFMYKIHASERLDKVLTPELARELGVGFETIKDRLKLQILKGTPEEEDKDTLFDGLLTLKRKANLYDFDTEGRTIQIRDNRLFQLCFTFPSATKAGEYQIETFLFKDKKLVGKAVDTIHVKKVGLEAFVVKAASEQPVLYGISAVLIALGAGLTVGYLFKGAAH